MKKFLALLVFLSTCSANAKDFSLLTGCDTLDVFVKDADIGTCVTSFAFVNGAYLSSENFTAGQTGSPNNIELREIETYDSSGRLVEHSQSMKNAGGETKWVLKNDGGHWAINATAGGITRKIACDPPKASLFSQMSIITAIKTDKIKIGQIWYDTISDLQNAQNVPQKIICIDTNAGSNHNVKFTVESENSPTQTMEFGRNGRSTYMEIPPIFTMRKVDKKGTRSDSRDLVDLLGRNFNIPAKSAPSENERIKVTLGGDAKISKSVRQLYDSIQSGWILRDRETSCENLPAKYPDSLLAPTLTVQCDDPKIIALADSVCHGMLDKCEIISRLTFHVYDRLIKKDTPAFSNASETLRAGYGDCGEHAVLLAALLRARGIGAQVMMGLVYMNGRGWCYHAWVNAGSDSFPLYADAALGRFPAKGGYIPLICDSKGSHLDEIAGLIENVHISYVKK